MNVFRNITRNFRFINRKDKMIIMMPKIKRLHINSDKALLTLASTGAIGFGVGFHKGAKSEAQLYNRSKNDILLNGFLVGMIGCFIGLLFPVSIPTYFIVTAYDSKYSKC